MKISVRTTHYTNDNSPQLRGYATVKFDDSYVLESVKIMERQDSNEIFIALPSLMVRTKDQNGNYVINDKGEYVKEFKEVFHPITAESRKVLNSAIMDSFNRNDGKTGIQQWSSVMTGFSPLWQEYLKVPLKI